MVVTAFPSAAVAFAPALARSLRTHPSLALVLRQAPAREGLRQVRSDDPVHRQRMARQRDRRGTDLDDALGRPLGPDVNQGVKNLEGCEDGVWSKGTVGAINSTCQQWTDGNVPTKEEVAYAIYLLTGRDIGLTGTPVPRFTLNDAGSGVG